MLSKATKFRIAVPFARCLATKPSYHFEPGSSVLTPSTLGQLLHKAADEAGDATSFVSCQQNIKKNFTEFKTSVDKLASGLLSLGLRRGDRIALCAPNLYEWPVVQFAAGKAGLILVNINPAYQRDELEYCLKKVGCRSIIMSETFKTQKYYDMLCSFVPELENGKCGSLKSAKLPDLQSVILITEKARNGTMTFDEVSNAGDSESDKLLGKSESLVQFDDIVSIQFTSGTTGTPKAAMLTHHNIVNNCTLSGKRFGFFEKKPISCCQVPLYHCFGCVLGSLGCVLYQHTCVFPTAGFDALASIKAVHDNKCTSIYGTPTMFVDLINKYKPSEHDISSLQQVIVGGAACPESVLKELRNRLNIPNLNEAYGLTETSPALTANKKGEKDENIYSNTIAPLEMIEFKVVNQEGRIVQMGEEGELCVRGHSVFVGYWKDEQKTAEAIDPTRWFHTGDLAKMSENGYVRISGRMKDMVNRGGENVYPLEVESFLHTHPAILEAHICGVPDQRLGEELCAWIRLREGKTLAEEEVKSFCKGKISHYKIPRYVMFVEEYPKTVSGKVQKFKMREVSIKKLNLKA